MRKLIVNADDFGMSEAVNYGILKGFEAGIVHSTTIMANMPAFDHAVSLIKEKDCFHVGVHLNLTCYQPLLKNHQTLVNENGYFKGQGNIEEYDEEEMYQELCAQIDKVLESGIVIDHLDSHHHIHTTEKLKPVIQRLLEKYPYPMRGGFVYDIEKKDKTSLYTQFYNEGVTLDCFSELMKNMKEHEVYDLMCHPAYLDKFVCEVSSYRMQRVEELALLCSKEVKEIIKKEQVELVDYSIFK